MSLPEWYIPSGTDRTKKLPEFYSRLDENVLGHAHFNAKSKEELDKYYVHGYPGGDGLDSETDYGFGAEPLSPVRTGIWTKVAAPEKHLSYVTRMMKSIWTSDVLQPMVIQVHGWDVQYPGMIDIYGGRNQGVPMLAREILDDGIVVMADDDIVFPPRWCSTVRAIFESDSKIGAIYPLVQEEADHFIQGIDGPIHGNMDIHKWTPEQGCQRGGYIHREDGLVYLDKDKLMKTLSWRSTDMCVFYRASMVKDFLHYNHDWFCWKIDQGWKVVLAKSFGDTRPFAVAHYKEFGERNTGELGKMLPFYSCIKCNHICGWGKWGNQTYDVVGGEIVPHTPSLVCSACNTASRVVE